MTYHPYFPCPIHISLAPYITHGILRREKKYVPRKMFASVFPFGSEIVTCGAL